MDLSLQVLAFQLSNGKLMLSCPAHVDIVDHGICYVEIEDGCPTKATINENLVILAIVGFFKTTSDYWKFIGVKVFGHQIYCNNFLISTDKLHSWLFCLSKLAYISTNDTTLSFGVVLFFGVVKMQKKSSDVSGLSNWMWSFYINVIIVVAISCRLRSNYD